MSPAAAAEQTLLNHGKSENKPSWRFCNFLLLIPLI